MQAWERSLERWQTAGLVDTATADRVRAYEAADAAPAGHRWQVVVALLFGSVLLAAGVLLFAAAHWDEVGPGMRLVTVLGLLTALHAGGLLASRRFPAMATALHGVATVACGAGIAMVGQIFNMQEHWPAAVLLWALCALAGWLLLRDQFQAICVLLLGPAWLVCEWSDRASKFGGSDVYLCRMLAVIAAVYLSAFVHARRRVLAGVLFGFAAVLLPISTFALTDGWDFWGRTDALPGSLHVVALLLIAGAIAAGWFGERRSVFLSGAVLLMSFALPWLRASRYERTSSGGYNGTTPSLLAYLLVALVTAFIAWWGVRERSRAVVNYAVAMFAVVVILFYFSSLMDKLGRSLGLIGLGLLFLLGGWLLERLRRKLVHDMGTEMGSEVMA